MSAPHSHDQPSYSLRTAFKQMRVKVRRRFRPAADWLALEWDDQHVTGVEARVSIGRVRVKRSFRARWPKDLQVWEMPERAGAWLREELRRAGLRSRHVVVLLPREKFVLKQLQVPCASDEELPEIVYFQAGVQSALPLKELCLDFFPPRRHKEESGANVLLAAAPRSVVKSCRRLIAAAGMELESIRLSPLAAGEVLVRVGADSITPNDLVMLLTSRVEGHWDISLLAGPQWIYSCSISVSGRDPEPDSQAVLASTTRMLVAARLADQDPTIGAVYLLGSLWEHGAFAEALARQFRCPVRVVSPFEAIRLAPDWQMPPLQSGFSGPIGGLLVQSGAALPSVDFLAPRRQVRKRTGVGLRRLVAGALIVCVAAGLGLSHWHGRLADLDRQITQLTRSEKELQERIKKGAPSLKTVDQLDAWTSNNAQWLDELLALTEQMPPVEQVYLSELQFGVQQESSRVSLRTTGCARGHDEVMALTARLLEDRSHYELQSPSIRSRPQDPEYPVLFQLGASILRPATTDSQASHTQQAGGGSSNHQ